MSYDREEAACRVSENAREGGQLRQMLSTIQVRGGQKHASWVQPWSELVTTTVSQVGGSGDGRDS